MITKTIARNYNKNNGKTDKTVYKVMTNKLYHPKR